MTEPETLTDELRAHIEKGSDIFADEARLVLRLHDAALARATKAEESYRWMVEHAADQKLDGYRELGARAAAAEQERDAALARAEAAERALNQSRECNGALVQRATYEHDAGVQMVRVAESRLAEATALLVQWYEARYVPGKGSNRANRVKRTRAFLCATPAPAARTSIYDVPEDRAVLAAIHRATNPAPAAKEGA